jgi:hypothetical protein
VTVSSVHFSSDAAATDAREHATLVDNVDPHGIELTEVSPKQEPVLSPVSTVSLDDQPKDTSAVMGSMKVLANELKQDPVLNRTAWLLWSSWFAGVCGYVNLNVFFPELLDRLGRGTNTNSVLFTAMGLVGTRNLTGSLERVVGGLLCHSACQAPYWGPF